MNNITIDILVDLFFQKKVSWIIFITKHALVSLMINSPVPTFTPNYLATAVRSLFSFPDRTLLRVVYTVSTSSGSTPLQLNLFWLPFPLSTQTTFAKAINVFHAAKPSGHFPTILLELLLAIFYLVKHSLLLKILSSFGFPATTFSQISYLCILVLPPLLNYLKISIGIHQRSTWRSLSLLTLYSPMGGPLLPTVLAKVLIASPFTLRSVPVWMINYIFSLSEYQRLPGHP